MPMNWLLSDPDHESHQCHYAGIEIVVQAESIAWLGAGDGTNKMEHRDAMSYARILYLVCND
jgi:hypothetical protein